MSEPLWASVSRLQLSLSGHPQLNRHNAAGNPEVATEFFNVVVVALLTMPLGISSPPENSFVLGK